ncbi:MAG: hypothetical protein P8I31_01975, partial [Bacteroidia bacterium]|nr:hypothetical protein [Bacteroidia bacterium]
MEELVVELFEDRDGADLNFVKNTYAEKFNWDASRNIAVPEEKYKKDIEDEVLKVYALAEQGSKADLFKKKLASALKRNDFELAVSHIDSVLVYEPNNATLTTKKNELNLLLEKIKKDREERAKFETLKKKGDMAFASGDLDEAESNYENALSIIFDNQIKKNLVKINQIRDEERSRVENEEKLKALRQAADSLRRKKEFSESINKISEIQRLDPSQRIDLQSEIKSVQKESEDFKLSLSVQSFIEAAERQFNSDSLDRSLFNYRRADGLIEKINDLDLVRAYSKKTEAGILKVSSEKTERDNSLFNDQMEKAKNNLEKGPEYYDLASRVLETDFMKSMSSNSEVKDLKITLKNLKKIFVLKEKAFNAVKTNKNIALADLKKAVKIAEDFKLYVPKSDYNQMKDSLNTWSELPKTVNS